MAPFKGGGGGRSQSERVLYSISQQLDAGGWINTKVLTRITYVPKEERPLRGLEQSNGRRSDHRQTALP